MTLRRILTFAGLLISFLDCTMSQPLPTQTSGSSEETDVSQQELQKKARGLLNEVAIEVRQLRALENRIRFQAAVADLMWDRDPAGSRMLFAQVRDDLINLIGSLNRDDPQYESRSYRFLQMRREVLSLISAHDADLALDFLRSTRQSPIDSRRFFNSHTDNELELEGSLASQIAQRDPRRALEIAEAGLAKGYSFPAVSLLWQLREKDGDAAAKLTDDIIKKIRSDIPPADSMRLNVAFGLLQMDLQIRKNTNQNSGQSKPPAPLLDDGTFQWLVEWAGTALTDSSNTSDPATHSMRQNMLGAYQNLLPDLEKIVPSAAAALRARMARGGFSPDDQTKRWQEFNALVANGSVEEVLQAAAKAPPEMQNNYFQQASWKALAQDDFDQARQIIRDHISDPSQRTTMFSGLENQIVGRMMNAGKLEQARQVIYGFRSDTERAKALAQLAVIAAAQQNRKLALQLSGEARGLLKGRIENQTQMNTHLDIARSLVNLMANQAADILDPLTERINTLMTAAAELDPFEREQNPSFQNGELIIQGGDFLLGLVQNFSSILGSLAQTDFDRAKSIADQLQHPEARIEAHVEILRDVLQRTSHSNQAGD